MTWEYEYDETSDQTMIYWNDEVQGTVDGQITRWHENYPMGDARDVVADAIHNAGIFTRIRMHYDFNHGFSEREAGSE